MDHSICKHDPYPHQYKVNYDPYYNKSVLYSSEIPTGPPSLLCENHTYVNLKKFSTTDRNNNSLCLW